MTPRPRIPRDILFDPVEPTRPTAVPSPLTEIPIREPEANAIDKDGPYYVEVNTEKARPPYGSPERAAKSKATQVYLDQRELDYLAAIQVAAITTGQRVTNSAVIRLALRHLQADFPPDKALRRLLS